MRMRRIGTFPFTYGRDGEGSFEMSKVLKRHLHVGTNNFEGRKEKNYERMITFT
jgi:hypothetical protein